MQAMQVTRPLRHWHFVAWERDLRNLKTVKLYGDRYMHLDRRLTLDRCPHRGASLSTGQLSKPNGVPTVQCPYHGRQFACDTHPEMFTGTIKDGALWVGGDDPEDIPRLPEFDDPSYRSLRMSRRLRGVNAMAFLESGIDFEHVSTVHSVQLNKWLTPTTEILPDSNLNLHTFYMPGESSLMIETRFWLPFTNSLKFSLFDHKRGKQWEPFILWFSMCPHGPDDVTLHIRSMRKRVQRDLDVLLDLFFIAVSDLPILEDRNVVRGVDAKRMLEDNLSGQDEFIALYRKRMQRTCPELVDYFCT